MAQEIKTTKIENRAASVKLVNYSRSEETPPGRLEADVTFHVASSQWARYFAQVRLVTAEGAITQDVMHGTTKLVGNEDYLEMLAARWLADMLQHSHAQLIELGFDLVSRKNTSID